MQHEHDFLTHLYQYVLATKAIQESDDSLATQPAWNQDYSAIFVEELRTLSEIDPHQAQEFAQQEMSQLYATYHAFEQDLLVHLAATRDHYYDLNDNAMFLKACLQFIEYYLWIRAMAENDSPLTSSHQQPLVTSALSIDERMLKAYYIDSWNWPLHQLFALRWLQENS